MYKELKIRKIIIVIMILALAVIIGVITAGILTSATGLFEPKAEYVEVEVKEISRAETAVNYTDVKYQVTYEVYYNNKTYTKVITYDTEESIPNEIKAYINKYNTNDIVIKATGLKLSL